MKQRIETAQAFNGPAYNFIGEDGFPTAILIPVIVATYKGKMWQLPNGVQTKEDPDGFTHVLPRINLKKATEIADKCCSNRFINSDHWVEVSEEAVKEYLRGSYGAVS